MWLSVISMFLLAGINVYAAEDIYYTIYLWEINAPGGLGTFAFFKYDDNNPVEFAKTLSKKIKELVENVKKSMQEEFNKSSKIPRWNT